MYNLRFRIFFLLLLSVFQFGFCETFKPIKPKNPKRFCKQAEQFYSLLEQSEEFTEITHLNGIILDLRYGTFDNISGHDLYCGGKRAFLHRDAAEKLKQAVTLLQRENPEMHFVIFDAARPLYAQEELRKTVRGTPFSHFVSSPKPGGMHNFGMAVDLTIQNPDGTLMDMGTDFDSFEAAAGKQGEELALKSGRLNKTQIQNRNFLRRLMKEAGFIALPSEWWHFNALPSKTVRAQYKRVPF